VYQVIVLGLQLLFNGEIFNFFYEKNIQGDKLN